jgi:hypothetical protein
MFSGRIKDRGLIAAEVLELTRSNATPPIGRLLPENNPATTYPFLPPLSKTAVIKNPFKRGLEGCVEAYLVKSQGYSDS